MPVSKIPSPGRFGYGAAWLTGRQEAGYLVLLIGQANPNLPT